jgi:sporulation protein YqfC
VYSKEEKMNLNNFIFKDFCELRLHCFENNEILLENYKKIIEYNDIQIKILTSMIIITVWGENLHINILDKNSVCINGKIENIEFTEIGVNKK